MEFSKIFREWLSESVATLELEMNVVKEVSELWAVGTVVHVVRQRLETVGGITGNEAGMIV